MALDLHSEVFSANGGIAAEGARRVLGRPKLGPLQLMVREALQNSWDARRPDVCSVQFAIELRRLTPEQQSSLRNEVFQSLPRYGLSLPDVLNTEIDVVVISDRGTVGLAGPTRIDAASDDDEPDNFIQFFRNVGRPRTGAIGGGTYGFGKASLYAASRASTIIAYSRVRESVGMQSRLMAAALGQQYKAPRRGITRRYTGRHWWGESDDEVVEPVTGAAADRLAYALGFGAFRRGETGTSVMVIAPRIPNGDGANQRMSVVKRMCSTAVWYAWPLMLRDQPENLPRLTIEGTCDGEKVEVPEVDEDPLLKEYAKAFRHALRARDSQPADPVSRLTMYTVECQRPIEVLGRLALMRVFTNVAPDIACTEDDEVPANSFATPSGPPAHVALMRGPRLVVRYMPAPVPPGVGVVGVFIAADELNNVFAEAEPATHDDWNHENLEQRRDRTRVRVTRVRISEKIEEFARLDSRVHAHPCDQPLGKIARLLGSLVPGLPGPGAEAQAERAGREVVDGHRGGGRRGPRIEMLPDVVVRPDKDRTIARFWFRIRGVAGSVVSVAARPAVLTADGGREAEAPIGAQRPKVIAWFKGDTQLFGTADRVSLRVDLQAPYAVDVTVPEDGAVSVQVFVDEEGES
jgi:hypothetical protein